MGCVIHLICFFVQTLFVVTKLVTDSRHSMLSLSQVIKFTLTGFTTHPPYYPQFIYITTVMIAAIIYCHVRFFPLVP